jgi:ribonucleoside-diphosphate reductase subunit M1
VLNYAKKQQQQAVTNAPARSTVSGRPADGANATGILTPISASPGRSLVMTPSTATIPSAPALDANVSDDILDSIPLGALSLDDTTLKKADDDAEFAVALERKYLRELEDAKLQCSLENKDACVLCSG